MEKTSGVASWIWGVILGDFNEDATVEQIIANTAITMIPVVDQVGDLRDLAANVLRLLDEEAREDTENWLMLSLTLIGVSLFWKCSEGTCKVAIKLGKQTPKDDLLAVLRAVGKGDPEKFLRNLQWSDYAKQSAQILSDVIKPCCEVGLELASAANKIGADELAKYFADLVDELKIVDKIGSDKIAEAMKSFEHLFSSILGKAEDVFPARVHHSGNKGSAKVGIKRQSLTKKGRRYKL